MFRNYVASQGIWDCPDQDQEIWAKHIIETEMFQMTSKEPMELIDEERGNLLDLEDVLESKHIHDSGDLTEDANEDNLEQLVNLVESPVLDLVIVSYILNARG